MKNCEFCNGQLAVLIEWDEDLCCDPLVDKYTCLKCPSSTTFVYAGATHTGYEYWLVRERDADGYVTKSHRLRVSFASLEDAPAYSLELVEWVSGGRRPRTIYKNIISSKVTPAYAERKIKTILTFM